MTTKIQTARASSALPRSPPGSTSASACPGTPLPPGRTVPAPTADAAASSGGTSTRTWAMRRAGDPAATGQRGTFTAVTLAMFCMEVSFLALMLALPDMARLFGTSPEVTQDALSAYLLSQGATLVVAGRLGDVAGRRRVFAAGCLLFAVTLAGAALAPSLPVLVVFRVLQGAGAGLMLPTGIALLTASYPGADRQARALGLSFALAAIGTVIGPLFGGWLAGGPGWRWIFWLLAPAAVLTVAVTVRFVPESRMTAPVPSFDVLGAVMVVLAVAAVGTGIDRADSDGWSGGSIALLAAGLAVIAVFPVRARRAAHPLVDLSVFRNPRFGLILFLGAAGLCLSRRDRFRGVGRPARCASPDRRQGGPGVRDHGRAGGAGLAGRCPAPAGYPASSRAGGRGRDLQRCARRASRCHVVVGLRACTRNLRLRTSASAPPWPASPASRSPAQTRPVRYLASC